MTTLATNLASKASSQLLGLGLTGVLKVYGKTLGASLSGLYELTSETPSEYTRAELITKSNSFGQLNEKRFPVLYLKVIATKDFKVGFIVDDIESDLETVSIGKSGLQTIRITVPRNVVGTSWSLRICSTGGYLKVLRVEGLPTVLHPKRH